MLTRLLSTVVLMLGLAMVSAPASADGGGVPIPQPAKAAKGETCVEPNDVMRRQHMIYLKHQRDDTLRQGIRGEKYSLNECIDCHATTSPEIAQGQVRTIVPFCNECHRYAAVKIDCFECHSGAADNRAPKTSALPDGHPPTARAEALLTSKLERVPQDGGRPQ